MLRATTQKVSRGRIVIFYMLQVVYWEFTVRGSREKGRSRGEVSLFRELSSCENGALRVSFDVSEKVFTARITF